MLHKRSNYIYNCIYNYFITKNLVTGIMTFFIFSHAAKVDLCWVIVASASQVRKRLSSGDWKTIPITLLKWCRTILNFSVRFGNYQNWLKIKFFGQGNKMQWANFNRIQIWPPLNRPVSFRPVHWQINQTGRLLTPTQLGQVCACRPFQLMHLIPNTHLD